LPPGRPLPASCICPAVAGLHLQRRRHAWARKGASDRERQPEVDLPGDSPSFECQSHHLQLERQGLEGILGGAGGFEGRAIRLIDVPPRPLLRLLSEKIPRNAERGSRVMQRADPKKRTGESRASERIQSNAEGPRRSRAAGPLSLNSRCYAISWRSAPRRATRCCSCRESSRRR
jgi:hypothetical protein